MVKMTKKPVKAAWTSDVPYKFPEVVKDITEFNKRSSQDIKTFAESTTAHGLKYAFSEKSSRTRRLAWFLAFLTALAYLSYQLVACSIDYYRYPMKAEYKLTRMNEMDFPTVTICNLNQADADKVDDPEALTDIYRVAKLCMWPELLNTTLEGMRAKNRYRRLFDRRYKDVLKQTSIELDDAFKFCLWNGEYTPCEQIIKPVWALTGKCFQLNANISNHMKSTRAGSNGGFFAAMKTSLDGHTASEHNSYGFKVILHHMYDTPDIYSQGILVSPGFSYHVSFQADTIKYLPHPYKSQGDMYCNEYPPPTKEELESGILAFGSRSLTDCVYSRAMTAATDLCGCDIKNCTLYEHLSCYEPNFNRIYDEATKTDLLGCPIPCTIRSYWPVISQAAFPSPDLKTLTREMWGNDSTMNSELYLGLSLYFEDLILREQLHEPVYNSLSLMGLLGGNMGLLLGASILTLAELLEFLLLLIWGAMNKNKDTAVTVPQ